MNWLQSLKFWGNKKKEETDSASSLRKLSVEEAMDLEACLAQNGLPINSQEEAEKYFYGVRDKELAQMKVIGEKFPELMLDNKAGSLQRLEGFYYKVDVDKTLPLI